MKTVKDNPYLSINMHACMYYLVYTLTSKDWSLLQKVRKSKEKGIFLTVYSLHLTKIL